MAWIAEDPASYVGETVGNGQCVAYVREACDAPPTVEWRCGTLVKGSATAQGTAVATFDPDGTYGNHTDGRSHAAILHQITSDGLLVWDQWSGHAVAPRLIRFKGGEGKSVNDGDQFHVIEHA